VARLARGVLTAQLLIFFILSQAARDVATPIGDNAMKTLLIALAATAMAGIAGDLRAQSATLVDATGKVAARPFNDTMMLVAVSPGVVAPAHIRPVYDAEGRAASGLATWASGGSVLFTSPDCTSGAHIFSTTHAGVRATSELETAEGVILYVGAIGNTRTASIRSILYGSGCSAVSLQQGGLLPVDATVNLTAAYPPPLSLQ